MEEKYINVLFKEVKKNNLKLMMKEALLKY